MAGKQADLTPRVMRGLSRLLCWHAEIHVSAVGLSAVLLSPSGTLPEKSA